LKPSKGLSLFDVNRIDPIAILNNSIGRDQRTAEAPGRRNAADGTTTFGSIEL